MPAICRLQTVDIGSYLADTKALLLKLDMVIYAVEPEDKAIISSSMKIGV